MEVDLEVVDIFIKKRKMNNLLFDRLVRVDVLRWSYKLIFENKYLEEEESVWIRKDNLRVVKIEVIFESILIEDVNKINNNGMRGINLFRNYILVESEY